MITQTNILAPLADQPNDPSGNQQRPPNKQPGKGPDGNQPPRPATGPGRGFFGILAALAIVMLLFMLFNTSRSAENVDWAEFKAAYEQGDFDPNSVQITDSAIVAVTEAGKFGAAEGE
ncbi:MAG: hypothetical protein AAFR76_12090, partial [Planctomycetota bacterium]